MDDDDKRSLTPAELALCAWATRRAAELLTATRGSDVVRIAWHDGHAEHAHPLPPVGHPERTTTFETVAQQLAVREMTAGRSHLVVLVGGLWVWAWAAASEGDAMVTIFEHALRADVARRTEEG